jgi:nitronate monooxygenase
MLHFLTLALDFLTDSSGVHANFLRESLQANGLDPDRLANGAKEDFSQLHADGKTTAGAAWKDVWSAGHGVVGMHDIPSVAELVSRLKAEYDAAAAK